MAKRGFNGAINSIYGARDHEVTVTGTELIAPGFLRVRMHSPTLLDGGVVAPTAYVRFWFPDADGTGADLILMRIRYAREATNR